MAGDEIIRPESSQVSVMGETKPVEERKALLARTVANLVAQGRRVESQSDFQAVLVRGKRVSHGIHIFLSIITLGLWIPIWLIIWFLNRERREIASVDDYGNVSVARV